MICFDDITYHYPDTMQAVLQDVSLDLPEGALVLVMGPSGAGKSTLLRCINGLVPHFSGGRLSGNIHVAGLDPVKVTPQKMSQTVGFVFQDPESQFVMDRVEDEVAFALENAAIPRQEMRVRVEETLDLLDLSPLRGRALDTLSGGERQRVAIAAALALRPRILVLDEPTSQLDPQSAEDVLNALVRLNTDLGLTILLAEHRTERVLPFVDRLLYVAGDGEMLLGEPQTVLAQIAIGPPLVQLGRRLGWQPLPLTIKDGLRFSRPLLRRWQERETVEQEISGGKAKTQAQGAENALSRGQPIIHIKDLVAGYDGEPVLHGVNLAAYAGDILVVMGRNGSGKTTLLKSIVGLVRPQGGEISIAGRNNARMDVAEICRQVGYLPQNPNRLLFADTVQEEVLVTLRNHGLNGAKTAESLPDYAQDLLSRLRIASKAGAYPRDLSVGERQRVALAAISVVGPQALLLDEPTRGLDYATKRDLADLLDGWRADGMAIVVVTHDVELAAAIADRVVLLSQGQVIASGDPATVLGSSPLFAPQIAKLFPGTGWLTPEDVPILSPVG